MTDKVLLLTVPGELRSAFIILKQRRVYRLREAWIVELDAQIFPPVLTPTLGWPGGTKLDVMRCTA